MNYNQNALNQTPMADFPTRPLRQKGMVPITVHQLTEVAEELAKSMQVLAARLQPVRRSESPSVQVRVAQAPEVESCELANTIFLVKAQLKDILGLVQRVNETLEL